MPDENITMDLVHLNWCIDILKRMDEVIKSDVSDHDKLQSLAWYIKQGLKVEKEQNK